MANDPLAVMSITRVQKVPDALHRDDAEQQRRRRDALRNARPGPAAGSEPSDTKQPSQESAVTGNHGKLHVTA